MNKNKQEPNTPVATDEREQYHALAIFGHKTMHTNSGQCQL